MARKKGQTYSAEKKVQIVLELLKEEQTVGQLAAKYQITAKSIQNWKKQFLENAAIAMEPAKAISEYKSQLEAKDEEIDQLHKALGKTTIEKDWAVKKLKSLDYKTKKLLIKSGKKDLMESILLVLEVLMLPVCRWKYICVAVQSFQYLLKMQLSF